MMGLHLKIHFAALTKLKILVASTLENLELPGNVWRFFDHLDLPGKTQCFNLYLKIPGTFFRFHFFLLGINLYEVVGVSTL